MRDRSWRRYVEERIVIKRIRRYTFFVFWTGLKDVNGIRHQHPKFTDIIGTNNNFRFKTHTTTKLDTRYKSKYSSNKGDSYWRSKSNTRENDRKIFLNILKENGLK
jgi:hypothetical protein